MAVCSDLWIHENFSDWFTESNQLHSVTTDDNGNYSIEIPPGVYGIEIPDLPGYWGEKVLSQTTGADMIEHGQWYAATRSGDDWIANTVGPTATVNPGSYDVTVVARHFDAPASPIPDLPFDLLQDGGTYQTPHQFNGLTGSAELGRPADIPALGLGIGSITKRNQPPARRPCWQPSTRRPWSI